MLGKLFFFLLLTLCCEFLSIAKAVTLKTEPEAVTLQDILKGSLKGKEFNGTWYNESTFQFFDIYNNIQLYNIPSQKTEIVLSNFELNNFTDLFMAAFSADKKFLLLGQKYMRVFRHSFYALYDVINLSTKERIPIRVGGVQTALRLVQWSPSGHSLIINYRNNLYFKQAPDTPEIQLTFDTDWSVYNGIPDWVYEEEVLVSNSAVWLSPDSNKLVYMKFNDSNVPVMQMTIFGKPKDSRYQYPRDIHFHYPKVNSPNPIVSLHFIDLQNNIQKSIEINPPNSLQTSEKDHIIASVSWVNNNEITVKWLNRNQNQGIFNKCKMSSSEIYCTRILTQNSTSGWLEFFTKHFYDKNGTQMFYLDSQAISDNSSDSSFQHLKSINMNDLTMNEITNGKFTVFEILALINDTLLFLANSPNNSKVKNLFAVRNLHHSKQICLTCGPEFAEYSYFEASISENGKYLALSSWGPNIPKIDLFAVEIQENNEIEIVLKHMDLWQSNPTIHQNIARKKIPKTFYDEIKLDDGRISNVMISYPSDLDRSKKYPMLIEVYGAPSFFKVTSKWQADWGTYLSSRYSIVYVKIDGRGTGLSGDKVLYSVYKKLGSAEVADQLETAKKLQEKYSFIDANRTGIWGKSYGGYTTGMALGKDKENILQCGASISPIVDLSLYDSIYIERYMGLFNENRHEYENANILNFVDNFRNKKFMLVHGSFDDNVHYQQSMVLSRALELKDIQFDQIIYPDEDHTLRGVTTHLYHSMEKFFKNCFSISV